MEALVRRGVGFRNVVTANCIAETGPGFACLSTGVYIKRHGICTSRHWFDKATRAPRYFYDEATGHVHLDAPTLTDMWKAKWPQARVAAVCKKDRQALLLGGPNADRIVYSYNEIVFKRAKEGSYKGRGVHEDHFSWTERVGRETPAYVASLRIPRRVAWAGDGFAHPDMDVADTPLIDRAIMDTALRVLEEESPDLFFVGLVSTNMVAHEYRPDSPENRDAILEVDRQIGRLIRWLEERGWLDETLVVVASDHGMTERPLAIDVTTHLKQADAGDVVENVLYFMAGSTGGLYLADTSPETVRRTLAAVRAVPHMKGAWHRDDPEAP